MKINLDKLLISTKENSRGNHLISDCPFCGKEDHFYLNKKKIFEKNRLGLFKKAWDCKLCLETGNLVKLLTHFDSLHLIDGEIVDITKKLVNKIKIIEEVTEEEKPPLPVKKLPMGFKRVYSNEYLESRGFGKLEFEKYIVGVSYLRKFRERVIISIVQDEQCRGYLSRSIKSKEEIKKIEQQYKDDGLDKKFLRWQNSKETDFSRMLLGYDEINFLTQIVILVEGFMDKVRIDQALGLDYSAEIKCCCTFGKSISQDQIILLKKKGIDNIIMIQDPDAVSDTKKHASQFKKEFSSVLLGYTGDKDCGDSTDEEIINVLHSLKTPEEFYVDKVPKKTPKLRPKRLPKPLGVTLKKKILNG